MITKERKSLAPIQTFWFLVALCPLLFLKDFGSSFGEIKHIGLALITILTFLNQERSSKTNINSLGRWWFNALALVLLIQLFSYYRIQQVGLYLQTINLTIALTFIPLFVSKIDVEGETFCRIMLIPILVTLVGTLSFIIFRYAIFFEYSPFGSTIGTKNSASIFLAQTIPLLLLIAIQGENKNKVEHFLKLLSTIILPFMIWIILANRTRSAWWMIAIYGIGLALFTIKKNVLAKLIFKKFLLSLSLGIAFLMSIPNALKWRSPTPYLDSFNSLLSIEGSSGRNSLWEVALEILKNHPFFGIGTGQYAPIWPTFIRLSEISPREFIFLRSDLPLFNDYLQACVENGIPLGIFYFIILFGIPALILIRNLNSNEPLSAEKMLFPLLCVGTAFNAFVDYPFNRPESVLLYSIALGFCLKQFKLGSPNKTNDISRTKFYKTLSLVSLSILLLFISLLTIGLGSKKIWTTNHNVIYLNTALKFWPWDVQWNHGHLAAFLFAGEIESSYKLKAARIKAWPNDPESFLIAAKLEEFMGNFEEAIALYRQAIHYDPKGFCYPPGFQFYNNFLTREDFPAEVEKLNAKELEACS